MGLCFKFGGSKPATARVLGSLGCEGGKIVGGKGERKMVWKRTWRFVTASQDEKAYSQMHAYRPQTSLKASDFFRSRLLAHIFSSCSCTDANCEALSIRSSVIT